jgi:hypothetical protein
VKLKGREGSFLSQTSRRGSHGGIVACFRVMMMAMTTVTIMVMIMVVMMTMVMIMVVTMTMVMVTTGINTFSFLEDW